MSNTTTTTTREQTMTLKNHSFWIAGEMGGDAVARVSATIHVVEEMDYYNNPAPLVSEIDLHDVVITNEEGNPMQMDAIIEIDLMTQIESFIYDAIAKGTLHYDSYYDYYCGDDDIIF